MHDWVRAEIRILSGKYGKVQHDEQLTWVLIGRYLLPLARFNIESSPLLFRIPVGYPNTAPDNFFVDGALQLRNGARPPSFNPGSNASNGPAPVAGNWGWFSWHPVVWRPAATIHGGDNLLTFLRGVNMCLRGEG